MDVPLEDKAATKSEISLASLSLLITFDKTSKQDYLDYLTPFIVDITSSEGSYGISRARIQELFREKFGLYIPVPPLELALKRLVHKRVLRFSATYGGVYSAGSLFPADTPNLNAGKNICLVDIRNVMAGLMLFASETFKLAWSAEQATDAVAGYLSHYGIDCLKACFDRTAITFVERAKESDFVVNAFIRNLLESRSDLSEKLVVLVKAQMLTNALLCPDIKNQTDLSGVTLFVDTPLVLRLLDLDTEAAHTAALETLTLCKNLGAQVAIFSHTTTEVFGVIKACAIHLDDPKFARGRIIREMRSRGTTPQELLLLADALETCLDNLGVQVISTPPHDPKFEIGEIQLDQALDEDIKYLNIRARQFDIDSIRAIYTLRAGTAPRTLETSKAVLVTTNSALARTAFYFGQKFENSKEVSTVVSSFSLANLAWLKGGSLSSRLPRAEMLSLAYAALQPSTPFWEKFLSVQEEMRSRGVGTPAQHALVRYSAQTQRLLMNLTLGDEEKITNKTVEEVMRDAEAAVVKSERDLRTKEAAQHGEELVVKEKEMERIENENEQLIEGLSKIIEDRRRARAEAAKIVHLFSQIVRWGCLVPSFALVAACWEIDRIISASFQWRHYATGSASLLLLALTLWGASPAGWSRKLARHIERLLMDHISRKYLPPFSANPRERTVDLLPPPEK